MKFTSTNSWRDWGTGILIGLLSADVFLPTPNNDFVDWDDIQNVLENAPIGDSAGRSSGDPPVPNRIDTREDAVEWAICDVLT